MTSNNKGLIKPPWNQIQIPLVAGLPDFKHSLSCLRRALGRGGSQGQQRSQLNPPFHYKKIKASLYVASICIYTLGSGLVKDSGINRSLNQKHFLVQQSVIVPDTESCNGSLVYMPVNYRVFLQLSDFCLVFGQALVHKASVSKQTPLFYNTECQTWLLFLNVQAVILMP